MTGVLAVEAVLAGLATFFALCRRTGAELPVDATLGLVVTAAAFCVVGAGLAFFAATGRRPPRGALPLALAAAALGAMAWATLYRTACYLRLPADILSFAESPYVSDIIKFARGDAVFSPAADNNSYPYSPGSQLLTYTLARLLGHGDSVPWYRYVQFSYVIAAALSAAAATDCLARRFSPQHRLPHRALWWAVWLPALFLLCTEPRFNLYTHSLHNDGLALLVSMIAAWTLAAYALEPRRRLLGIMAVLPAAGFMVKQNQLLWGGVFVLYFLFSGQLRWRAVASFTVAAGLAWAAVVALCYHAWGEPYRYWVFEALGSKQVALSRSLLHLLMSGLYANLGLAAGWALVVRERIDRVGLALWLSWLLPFALAAFTSGLGYQPNHLGPGVVLAGCWALAALAVWWPAYRAGESVWLPRVRAAILGGGLVLAFGGLGFVRKPIDPVPADVWRYIAAIDREFDGLPRDEVLLDAGSWVYLRDGIVMKDRSAPVSMQVGRNQSEIGRQYLAATIRRFERHAYRRVLAREIDTRHSWYDFNDRGSGVKQALLDNYHEVRRIPGVEVDAWWPPHLLGYVVVLEPNDSVSATAARGGRRP